jgi:hypothetical protein
MPMPAARKAVAAATVADSGYPASGHEGDGKQTGPQSAQPNEFTRRTLRGAAGRRQP